MKRAIHWFRRDLRVADNTALSEAARRSEAVIPVFIIEDALRTGPDVGAARLAFLLKSVAELRNRLAELGYPLVVRHGKSEDVLPALCQEVRAEAVFCNRRYEPYAQARDNRLFNILNGLGIGFEVFKDAVIWEEAEILTQSGKPFTVFTPYAKAWKSRPPPPPRPALAPAPARIPQIKSERIPEDPAFFGHPLSHAIPPAGETAARERLDQFLNCDLFSYATQRDFPAVDGTACLSPHLRCGTIGIRHILASVKARVRDASSEKRRNADVFVNELIWREFFLQILANYPHVMRGPFHERYSALPWSGDEAHFQAWREGRTGYPIVDAAMRCLSRTGWMHNRLRMITAMFLAKDLLIDWRRGERWFMQTLVDGDMAANNGGWQWCAGTGTDAAPYFRIFNPIKQGLRFDPDGEFTRRWIPELSAFPGASIHEPWKSPLQLRMSGYPDRVVLHEEQRPKCLAMYQTVRNASALDAKADQKSR